MSGRDRGPGAGRGRYRGGDEVDGLERRCCARRGTGWTTTTGMNSREETLAARRRGCGSSWTTWTTPPTTTTPPPPPTTTTMHTTRTTRDEVGPSSGRVRASRPLPSRGRASPSPVRPNRPPPPDDRRPSRVAAWATRGGPRRRSRRGWRSRASARARSRITGPTRATPAHRTRQIPISRYDPGSTSSSGGGFRYGADREPVWAAILARSSPCRPFTRGARGRGRRARTSRRPREESRWEDSDWVGSSSPSATGAAASLRALEVVPGTC